jgi:hypothetical protein
MVKNMLEIIAIILWCSFTLYLIWYATSAKHYFPITDKEAKILWKIHKQNINCNSTKWRKIKRNNKIIGFACECGYEYIQKRPLVINPPTCKTQTEASMFEKLHTSYKST